MTFSTGAPLRLDQYGLPFFLTGQKGKDYPSPRMTVSQPEKRKGLKQTFNSLQFENGFHLPEETPRGAKRKRAVANFAKGGAEKLEEENVGVRSGAIRQVLRRKVDGTNSGLLRSS